MTVQAIPHSILTIWYLFQNHFTCTAYQWFWLAKDFFTINNSVCLIRQFKNCFVLNNEKKLYNSFTHKTSSLHYIFWIIWWIANYEQQGKTTLLWTSKDRYYFICYNPAPYTLNSSYNRDRGLKINLNLHFMRMLQNLFRPNILWEDCFL